ncbi:MAG: MalY/PatB family protein [Collinsella intestinalis]
MGLKPENIGYENGVLGGVANALAVVCSRGDKVLVHAPTYTGFTNTLKNAGYDLVTSWLQRDAEGVWRMDYEDMERKLATREVHAAILCSPHNPTGRVWERWELERAMGLFRKYDVYVISDEIWSDIVLGGSVHIPTQSVSDDARMRTVALYAPSKTFNLAGLIGSYRVVYNPWLQARLAKQASLSHYNMQNVLSMHALLGAYSDEGAAWVDELREVLGRNARIASEFFEGIAGVDFARPQGTYMLFLDCDGWCAAHGMDIDELLRSGVEVGVLWQDGRPFGGDKTIRINLALPTARLREALERLAAYVFVR